MTSSGFPVHPCVRRLCGLALLASAACGVTSGSDTGTGDTGTDSAGTDGSSGGSSPTTSTSTTTPSTTVSSTTLADTGSESSDTSDSATSGEGGCLGSGTYTAELTDRTDLYGRFPFLMLFFAPLPADPVPETFVVEVTSDGSVTVEVTARDPGSGSGHEGLAGLVGTLSGSCDLAIATTAVFTNDYGSFGELEVLLAGIATDASAGRPPALAMTLQDHGIRNMPITYEFVLMAQE